MRALTDIALWEQKGICICVFVYLYICVFVYLCICVFVYLYICVFVYLCICAFVYLCICVFVFVYLCMRHLGISVLISSDLELSENIWFVWSKTS